MKKKELTFKDLVLRMYRGFPNVRTTEEEVHKIVISDEDRERLEKQGYLYKEEYSDGEIMYGLGPNALNLVAAWKTEKLTEGIKRLTNLLLFFTTILAAFAFVQIIISVL